MDRVHHLRHEYHRRILTDMSTGFGAFCHQGVGPTAFHSLCQSHACHNRNHFYARFFPHFHILFRASGTCCYNLYSFFHDDLRYLIRIRTHQHNVDTKRFVSQFFRFSDLVSYPVCRSAGRADQAKSAGIRYCRRKFMFSHPGHPSLDDRIFNPKDFCNFCLHSKIPSFILQQYISAIRSPGKNSGKTDGHAEYVLFLIICSDTQQLLRLL